MAELAKRLILNRETDFTDNGILKNLKFENDVMFSNSENGESSVFISKCFDTEVTSCTWNRIRIYADIPADATINFRLYCSNRREITFHSTTSGKIEKVGFDEFLDDPQIDFNRKIAVFKGLTEKIYHNITDILPYDVEGRYMWFFLELITLNDEPVKIEKIRFEFPKISFVDYLPEIYKASTVKNNFLERFLGIFQSIYIDFEEQIDNISYRFDTEQMTQEFLLWIVSWLNLPDSKLWQEKKLRDLLKKIVKLYKIKGTKASIFDIVTEFCGEAAFIIEHFEIKKFDFYKKHKTEIDSLFGNTGRVFTVILRHGAIGTSEKFVAALSVINSMKPIDSTCNLVVLANEIYLGHHSYLGINSFITKNYDLVLDSNEKDINTLMLRN